MDCSRKSRNALWKINLSKMMGSSFVARRRMRPLDFSLAPNRQNKLYLALISLGLHSELCNSTLQPSAIASRELNFTSRLKAVALLQRI